MVQDFKFGLMINNRQLIPKYAVLSINIYTNIPVCVSSTCILPQFFFLNIDREKSLIRVTCSILYITHLWWILSKSCQKNEQDKRQLCNHKESQFFLNKSELFLCVKSKSSHHNIKHPFKMGDIQEYVGKLVI